MLFTPAEAGGGYQEQGREEYSAIKSDVLRSYNSKLVPKRRLYSAGLWKGEKKSLRSVVLPKKGVIT